VSFKDLVLVGGKGGGGSFKNRPDNLRSTDTFEALIGLTSSRAKLAPGGLKNLFVDDVPVEDGQGKASFKDFTAVLFDGDPTGLAPIKLNLGASAGPNNVGLTITNTNASGPGDWVNAAVTQPNVDFIDIRLLVQQLYRQDKKGIYDENLRLQVELRPSGATTWRNPLISNSAPAYNPDGITPGDLKPSFAKVYVQKEAYNSDLTTWADSSPGVINIKGKTNSPFVKELRIAVPNSGAYANKTWEIRVRLMDIDYQVSGENGENEVRRTVQWESVAGASSKPIGGVEEWRGISFLQVFGKASDQINGVPEITGIYDLGRYAVPPSSVFDPLAQTYTGAAWDGVTTQIAWTQCPAWQLKGLVEDDLSGVSALVPGSTLNKWDVLEASKWFAERVPDGKGGTQPRYTANWIIENQMAVGELVNYLAGAVGAFAWDEGDGRWRLKVEKPETPQMIFTKENIVGEFIYSHTDFDSRFNDFTGVFRNRDNRYKEDRVRTFDQPSIDATGRRHTTVALVGCDNRQEALRRLELRKLTSLNETRLVTFMTNRQGGLLEPFSVIGIADGDLNSNTALRSTGRITSIDSARTSITVRDSLRLELGVAYKVHVTIPNPEYNPETTSQPASADWRKPTITISRNITNTAAQRGDIFTLNLDQALPANLPAFAPIALEAVGLPALPKQYRVLSVVPSDDGEMVTISASEIYTAKWLESDNVSEDQILAQMVDRTVPQATAPAGGMFQLKSFVTDFVTKRQLSVNWLRPGSMFLDGYRLEVRHNGGPWQQLGRTRDTVYELQEPQPGIYDFRIYVIDRRRRESLPLEGSYEFTEQLQIPPAAHLTNESANVIADKDGNVTAGDWLQAGGTFVLTNALGIIDTDVVFSIKSGSATGGLNAQINAATGVYSVTGMTADAGSVTFVATWAGFAIEKILTVTKQRPGQDGTPAKLLVVTSDRQTITTTDTGAAEPNDNTQTINFTIQTQNTTGTVRLELYDLAGTQISMGFVAITGGGTVTQDGNARICTSVPSLALTPANFTNARGATKGVILKAIRDGVSDQISVAMVPKGATGAAGLSIAEVTVYQRKAGTAPAVPTGGIYNFGTKVLTAPTGWSSTIPTGTDPLYASTGTAFVQGTSGTATPTWAGVGKLAEDGAKGVDGAGVDVVFLRAAAQPATPAASAGTPSGWYSDISSVPAGSDPIWSSFGQRGNSTSNYTWDTPARVTGIDGAAGLSVAELLIFQRKSGTAPTTPTGGSYNFATKALTPPSGWSATVPDGTDPLYAAKGTASVQGTSGTVTPTWAGVGKMAQDGGVGQDGSGVDVIFIRSAAQPATPGASAGVPTGWYTDSNSVPASSNPLWSSFGQRPNSTSNWTWDAPARIEGATGETGPTGPAGVGSWTPVHSPTITRNGGSFMKNGPGAAAGFNAEVRSVEGSDRILVQWRWNSTAKNIVIGVSKNPAADATHTSIEYGVCQHPNGNIYVAVNGVNVRAITGGAPVVTTDLWAIAKRGSSIVALKNGLVLDTLTSSVAASDIYYLDCSFDTVGGGVDALTVGAEAASVDAWTPIIIGPLTRNGNTFTKAGANAWDASVRSAEAKVGATVTISGVQAGAHYMIGLDKGANSTSSYTDIDYALYLNGTDQTIRLYLNGVATNYNGSTSLGTWADNASASVEHRGTQIAFYLNGVEIATPGTVLATDAFAIDTSFFTAGSSATVTASQRGAQGPAGPVLTIKAPSNAFTFVDNVLSPASQTITVSAFLDNVATAVAWAIKKADGSVIRSVASATTLAVTNTDLGTNDVITIEASYNSTTVATAPIGRRYSLSADAQAIVNYQKSNALGAGGVLLDIAANTVVDQKEKRKYLLPEVASINSTYARVRAQAVARGVSVVALDTAYNNLGAANGATTGYLAPFHATSNPNGTSLKDTSLATSIDQATYTSYFQAYYDRESEAYANSVAAASQTATVDGNGVLLGTSVVVNNAVQKWSDVQNDNGNRPADGATADLVLVPSSANIKVTGNNIQKVAGAATTYDYAYARNSIKGSCRLEVRGLYGQEAIISMAPGFIGDPNYNNGPTNPVIQMRIKPDLSVDYYSNGSLVQANIATGVDSNTTFSMEYDNVNMYLRVNGGNNRIVALPPDIAWTPFLFIKAATGATVGGQFRDVKWTTFTDNYFDATKMGPNAPANGATADIKPVSIGSSPVTINGNRFSRNSGTGDYNACVRADPIPEGGGIVEADIVTTAGQYTMVAMDDDATSTNYSAMKIMAHYHYGNGTLAIYRTNGTQAYSATIGQFTGKLAITYDRVNFKVWVGGEQRAVSYPETYTGALWPKWHLYNLETVMTGLRVAPFTDNFFDSAKMGPNAPVNNASKNVISRGATAHANPGNGDIWTDTSVTPNVVKTYVSGAWQPAGNYVTEGSHIGVANGATKNVVSRGTTAHANPVNGDIWTDTSVTPNVVKTYVSGAWFVAGNYVTEGSHIGVENGADVTANNTPSTVPPTAQTFYYDSSGAAKSEQLPRTLAFKRYKGSVEVTQANDTEWTITANGCTATISNTDGSGIKGQVTVTAVASTGYIQVTSTKDGVAMVDKITITRVQDATTPVPPAPAAGTTSFDSEFSAGITDTSFDGTPQLLGTGTMRSNASGNVVFSGYINFYAGWNKAANLFVKLEKSLMGANSWSQLTVTGGGWSGNQITASASNLNEETVEGFINLAGTGATGANNTDFDFRMVAYKSGSTTTVPCDGILSGRQS
jgi:hypothetical protein